MVWVAATFTVTANRLFDSPKGVVGSYWGRWHQDQGVRPTRVRGTSYPTPFQDERVSCERFLGSTTSVSLSGVFGSSGYITHSTHTHIHTCVSRTSSVFFSTSVRVDSGVDEGGTGRVVLSQTGSQTVSLHDLTKVTRCAPTRQI